MAEHDLHDLAREQIVTAWNPDAGNLQTAPSHTDYFGTNLAEYTEALSDIDLDWAVTEFDNWRNSLYPSGFAPHYLSKPHLRGVGPLKVDTSWIDRRVLGTTELPNGEHVSEKTAPPNWAIAAKTIADRKKQNHSQQEAAEFVEEYFSALCRSSLELYQERGANYGRIFQIHKDELTLRDGFLADELNKPNIFSEFPTPLQASLRMASLNRMQEVSPDGEDYQRLNRQQARFVPIHGRSTVQLTPVNDAYIQALLHKNDACLRSLADEYGLIIPDQLMALTNTSAAEAVHYNGFENGRIENWLGRLTIANQFELSSRKMSYLIEDAARLEAFDSGVPTHIYDWEPNKVLRADSETDKGSINHALSIQVGKLLMKLSQKEHLGVPLQDKAQQIGFTIIENSVAVIERDGFVRQSDPNDSSPKTARTGLGQKVGRSQPIWTPTAVAVHNALPELSK